MVKVVITGFLRLLYHHFGDVLHTLKFNFHYFPFREAILLPVIISRNIRFIKLKGNVTIANPLRYGMIRIGYGEVFPGDGDLFGSWAGRGPRRRIVRGGTYIPVSLNEDDALISAQRLRSRLKFYDLRVAVQNRSGAHVNLDVTGISRA